MKIGILTYHFADNYGAVLQAKATYELLKSAGHEVSIINYASDFMMRCYRLNPLVKAKRKILTNTMATLRRYKQYNKFEDFRKKELGVSNKYLEKSPQTLSTNFDAIVCGSDQVWNMGLSGNDMTYFLDYVPDSVKKIGYAVSTGKNDTSALFSEAVLSFGKRFERLSFREETAATFVGNITKEQYPVVVDPVFLVDSNHWKQFAKKPDGIEENEKFILIYQLERNETLVNKAKELAKKENIAIKAIHPTCVKLEKDIDLLNGVGPAEFLWLIQNAQYVCSNSFHCMAFSIIFNKKMVSIAHKTLGDRNRQLLQMLGISESNDVIDFSKTNKSKIEESVAFSQQWLEESVGKKCPSLYEIKGKCCGCSACYSVCPVGAITMQEDEEGFEYPVIDHKKCIGCFKCVGVCDFKKQDTNDEEKIKVYAVRHQDEEVRMKSRSGGIFTALSDMVLKNNGRVYGCVLDENFEAVHLGTDSQEDRDRMRESKYVQSRMGDNFASVKVDLDEGKKVLFSGTSCQIAGLKKYLGKFYDNLLCVDIVCHGVPSPRVWKDYLKWQEKKHHAKCKKVSFRNKQKYGWTDHVETIEMDNGKVVDSKIYTSLFYGHTILRPSCHICPYKNISHPGDITIADYWGIEKAAPEFHDNKGVSLVLVNTPKGEEAFGTIKDQILYKETKIEDSLQPPLIDPFEEPDNRKEFWEDYYSKPFDKIVSKYGNGGIVNEVKKFSKKVKYKLKSMLSK